MKMPKILIVAIAIVVALIVTGCQKTPSVSNEQMVIVTEACTVAGMNVKTTRWMGSTKIAEVGCVPRDTVPDAPVLTSVK